MKQINEQMNERVDKEILYSQTIKAGKRVYYIDVKRDRRDAYYLCITESKRLKEGTLVERPVFEKHKIFLYREDLEKFMGALTAAVGYAIANAPEVDYSSFHNSNSGGYWNKAENEASPVDGNEAVDKNGAQPISEDSANPQKDDFDLNLDF